MDRPTLKIEVPLPRWPTSQIARFSIRTLLLSVAAIAIGLSIYRYARDQELAKHQTGYMTLVVSTPNRMLTSYLRCEEYASILELVRSPENGMIMPVGERTAEELWPPKIWIVRPDWCGDELEERILVKCAGTPRKPEIDLDVPIKKFDQIFFDYGRPRFANADSQPHVTVTNTVDNKSEKARR